AVLAHPTEFAKRDNTKALQSAADAEFSLADRISRSLVAEQYPLDQRNTILFPPEVAGKEISIRMIVSKANDPLLGVSVAQGNNTNGYSLYNHEDALHFAVAQDEKLTIISSKKDLAEEQFTIDATLVEDGSMSLKINGTEVAKGKTKGLFAEGLKP